MKWTRNQYLELMTFGDVQQQMFVELFGLLTQLEEEWRKQKATEEEINLIAFDWDYVPLTGCGGNTGQRGGFKPEVIEENEKYIIRKDSLGRKTKLIKDSASIALPMDYPVENMEDWLKIKHLYKFHKDRIDQEQIKKAKKLQKKGYLVTAWIPGGFDLPRQLMGEENVCLAFYQHPDLIHDILETVGNTAFKVLEKISQELIIDNLRIPEDLAGKSGPLIGPDHIEEFLKPYYRKIWDMLSERGTKLFSQDSDGDLNAVIDAFIDCGVNVMFPMEPAAGMDIVELRKKYGKKIAFKGGIDKHVLRKSKEDIRKELEYKMQPLMQEGGTVFGLDHRIPNGTSLENYKYYVKKGRELLGLPPLTPERKGWEVMAF
ncbi:MAG: uroporphyrinogen decarboxylase family protein [Bacillota bacterium]